MTLAIEHRATPQDLLESRGRGRFELVDGELVEKPMAKESNRIGGRFTTALNNFCDAHPIALVYPEQEFMCFGATGDATRIRKPDVAVVLSVNFIADADDSSFFNIRPNIAIEVLSPSERPNEQRLKLRDYELAGVPLVWVVEPLLREITIRPLNGPIITLRATDTLTAEPILPGFSVKVADLFPPPVAPPTPAAAT